MTELPPSDDEYFVGYLPTPPRTTRFALSAGVVALALALALAYLLATGMARPGRGYERGGSVELTGVFTMAPAPLLWVADDADDPSRVRAVLLVQSWKAGLPASAAELDDHVVHVRGQLLAREGWRMVAIGGALEEAELDAATLARLRARTRSSLGEVTLRGEIVDEKCFLGSMRPGTGRAHRACAQQCIAGGIPAVMITRDAQGAATQYLLVDAGGAAIGASVLPWVAEPVEVRGTLMREGDLVLLATSPESITRL